MVKSYVQVGRAHISNVRAVGSPVEADYARQMKDQANGIAADIQGVIDRVKGATPQAIKTALKPIFDLSQTYVPVDTGDLKRSGFLEAETTRSGVVRVAIGYGRFGQPWYAALVHEDLDMQHQQGKSAKFLERAVQERIHIFKALLISEMTASMGMSKRQVGRTSGRR